MKAVDFFCGAGGLTRGMLDAGIDVVLGIDVDGRCRQSYAENNSSAEFVNADLRKLCFSEIAEKIGGVSEEHLLFAGCAPCQPFSQQRKETEELNTGTLLGAFGRFVERFKPGQVFIENVPGIAKVSGFSTYRRFLKMLRTNGYNIAADVVDAKKYGVPQNRRRFILIGMRGAAVSLPPETHGPMLKPYLTVREAIGRFPRIRAGRAHSEIPNHVAAEISELNMERLRHTPRNGGDRRAWPEHLTLECHRGDYNGHSDVYGRMWWNKPAPALTGRCHSISNGRYGHPSQNRAMSLREAASLQTFDDEYVFHGSNKHIALQIGNAVPVRLAEVVAKHILRLRSRASKAVKPSKRPACVGRR